MMASLRESKKSLRACPCSFIFPMIKPKHSENTTSPRALTPLVVPERGITSSLAISWVALVRLNIESFTITFTWMILLPYWVLNYRRKKRRRFKNEQESDQSCLCYSDVGIWISRNVLQKDSFQYLWNMFFFRSGWLQGVPAECVRTDCEPLSGSSVSLSCHFCPIISDCGTITALPKLSAGPNTAVGRTKARLSNC